MCLKGSPDSYSGLRCDLWPAPNLRDSLAPLLLNDLNLARVDDELISAGRSVSCIYLWLYLPTSILEDNNNNSNTNTHTPFLRVWCLMLHNGLPHARTCRRVHNLPTYCTDLCLCPSVLRPRNMPELQCLCEFVWLSLHRSVSVYSFCWLIRPVQLHQMI